jgi:hypothetical protein
MDVGRRSHILRMDRLENKQLMRLYLGIRGKDAKAAIFDVDVRLRISKYR